MPTFLKDRKRNPWKGQVKRQGFKPEAAYFPTEDEAKEWEEMRRGALRRKSKGMTADIADLAKITVGQMVDRYLKEETCVKASHREESYILENFRSYKDFKTRPLIAFVRADAVEYRNYLEKDYRWVGKPYERWGKLITPTRTPKSLKPGTVRRQIAIFKDMWNIAMNDWRGYESLKELGNPWINVTSRATPKKRTRRLDDLPARKNELERLLNASNRCFGINKIYMKLAINLAVQTGMRLQEILFLKWRDINLIDRRIYINKSKMDYRSDDDGRTIVLTFFAEIYFLQAMVPIIANHGRFDPDAPIFQLSKSAFKQTWKRVTKWADIPSKEEDAKGGIKESQCGLEFKDLRREAGSRFDEAGLTKAEHDLMLGHESQEIRGIYIAPYLDRIDKKLEEYWKQWPNLVDKTLRQAFEQDTPLLAILKQSLVDAAGLEQGDRKDALEKVLAALEEKVEKENETAPLPEAISNVIPFIRKQGGRQHG